MMMSPYLRAIYAVAFWWVIVVLVPLAFLLAFMMLISAVACWWKSALLLADAISWSILLGSGMLSSLFRIRNLPALLNMVVGAGAKLADIISFRGRTISHRQVGDDADFVTTVSLDGFLSLSIGAGFYFGFGFGFGLSFIPDCSCWRSSGFSCPPVCVKSACIEASRLTPLVSALLVSFWP